MKTLNKILLPASAIITAALMTTGANAYTGNDTSLYVGAKAGKFIVDKEDIKDEDNPMAYGIYAGMNFDQNFGAEIEYLRSEEVKYESDVLDMDYTSQALGAYGTYRYYLPNTSFYGKGKVGAIYKEAEANATTKVAGSTTTSSSKTDETTFAAGVGVGVEPTDNLGIEAEYTRLGEDDGAVSVGVHFKF